MKTTLQPPNQRLTAAFTLIEVMASMLIISIMFISLYVGFAQGYGVVQLARENLRATQVLQEKMETLRLYTWTQVTSNGFIPNSFTAPFYAVGSQSNIGFTFYGSMKIEDSSVGESYADMLKEVTVTVWWTNGGTRRVRSMQSFVGRNGLQNYVW